VCRIAKSGEASLAPTSAYQGNRPPRSQLQLNITNEKRATGLWPDRMRTNACRAIIVGAGCPILAALLFLRLGWERTAFRYPTPDLCSCYLFPCSPAPLFPDLCSLISETVPSGSSDQLHLQMHETRFLETFFELFPESGDLQIVLSSRSSTCRCTKSFEPRSTQQSDDPEVYESSPLPVSR
jgi:hypothetical protein